MRRQPVDRSTHGLLTLGSFAPGNLALARGQDAADRQEPKERSGPPHAEEEVDGDDRHRGEGEE